MPHSVETQTHSRNTGHDTASLCISVDSQMFSRHFRFTSFFLCFFFFSVRPCPSPAVRCRRQRDGRNKHMGRFSFLHRRNIQEEREIKIHSEGNEETRTRRTSLFLSFVLLFLSSCFRRNLDERLLHSLIKGERGSERERLVQLISRGADLGL